MRAPNQGDGRWLWHDVLAKSARLAGWLRLKAITRLRTSNSSRSNGNAPASTRPAFLPRSTGSDRPQPHRQGQARLQTPDHRQSTGLTLAVWHSATNVHNNKLLRPLVEGLPELFVVVSSTLVANIHNILLKIKLNRRWNTRKQYY